MASAILNPFRGIGPQMCHQRGIPPISHARPACALFITRAVQADDRRAFGRQRARGRSTNAACRSGNEGEKVLVEAETSGTTPRAFHRSVVRPASA